MIRASKHTTKFANVRKLENLRIFIAEYRRVAQAFIDYLWNNSYCWETKPADKDSTDPSTNADIIKEYHEFDIKDNELYLPSMLTSDIIEKSKVDTFLTGRALKCCLTQVAGMINAETEKQRKRIYMLGKLKAEGAPRRQRKQLIKKLKQNIPVKPNASNINPELNSICCDFDEMPDSKEFDGFIRLHSITKTKLDIRIPIKHTKHSRSLQETGGTLKNSFLVSAKDIDFRWDIPTPEKKTNGRLVGADQGKLDVLSLSDAQKTPKTDAHGHSLDSIIAKLCRKRKGSAAFGRAQDHRKNFINWSINQLNFADIREIKLEEIWNIGYKHSKSRSLSHWTNTLIRDKVESVGEALGVQVTHSDSTYKSQRCSSCGLVRKANRKGKIYTCCNCGNIVDSDYNASLNHEQDLPEIPYEFRKLNLNRGKGFFYLATGLFDLAGRSLQSLPPAKRPKT